MKTKLLLSAVIAFFFFISVLPAQIYTCSIEGYVTDGSTGKPVNNVNVYISGTLIGATTNDSGYYKIKSVPLGRNYFVASIIGYKSEVKEITFREGESKKVDFKLSGISYTLPDILVKGKLSPEWKLNLKIFKKYFCGNSKFADECEIKNPQVINFSKSKTGILKAFSERPILIINNALGYKIRCELKRFSWIEETHTVQYLIYTFFSQLNDSTGNLKDDWVDNRETAYTGSLHDFMNSLINDSYMEKGFGIYKDSNHSMMTDALHKVWEPIISKMKDSYYFLNFDYYLRVHFQEYENNRTRVSWIKINFPNVILDKFGYPVQPFAYKVYGYWSYSGVAELLPKYYNPYRGDDE